MKKTLSLAALLIAATFSPAAYASEGAQQSRTSSPIAAAGTASVKVVPATAISMTRLATSATSTEVSRTVTRRGSASSVHSYSQSRNQAVIAELQSPEANSNIVSEVIYVDFH